ncbi:hypothetical protein FB451DRAFT_1417865 [Mycena latifolia]|nr:hypothetical protein FB451DRAFT_1417865 [Mycena latifolia]
MRRPSTCRARARKFNLIFRRSRERGWVQPPRHTRAPPPVNPARRRHSIIFWKRLGQGYDASEGTRARRVLRALTSRRRCAAPRLDFWRSRGRGYAASLRADAINAARVRVSRAH